MTMIELKREDSSEGLGITVMGYRTADGRYVAMHCQWCRYQCLDRDETGYGHR